MSVGTAPRPRTEFRTSIRGRIQKPLYRNGYALIASSGLTSLVGVVYWMLAAREYSRAAIGVSSALISATTTLAALSQLNLKNALNRFLPRAGNLTHRLVVRSYLVSLIVAGVVAAVFVVGLGVWSPRLAFLRARPGLGLWFVLATMLGTIFVLQDSVLTGIRRSVWVPAENLLYAVAKVLVLVALVGVTPTLGPFVAWTATLPLLVAPISLLLFRRLLPIHVGRTRDRPERITARSLIRFAAGDYLSYVVMTATMGVLPLIVLATRGADANAYYFLAWSIAYGVYLIAGSMGQAMIAEAAHDPAGLARYNRESLVETARLVIPCVAVLVVATRPILGLLGSAYARADVTLLRLLVLSAVPWIVFVAYVNTARVERRIGAVVRAHAVLFGLVLAIGLPLLSSLGINGLGIGWLAAQSIVAAAILARGVARPLPGDLLDGLIRTVSAARIEARGLAQRRSEHVALTWLRRQPGCSDWVIRRRIAGLNDVAIAAVGPPGSPPVAILKRAFGEAGKRSVWEQGLALIAVHRSSAPGKWKALVPKVITSGAAGRQGFVVETYVPGTTLEDKLRAGGDLSSLFARAARAIRPLHASTARLERLDEALLGELVDKPVARLRGVIARRSRVATALPALEGIRRELRAALAGREIRTAHIHGDFSPGNVVMDSHDEVQGIVDWERHWVRGLPQLDLVQLLLGMRALSERRELGALVAAMRRDPAWRTSALDSSLKDGHLLPNGVLLLLGWLHHLAANVEKSVRYARSRVWVQRNIDPVLRSFGSEAVLAPPARVRVSLPSLGAWLPSVRTWPLELLAPLAGLGLATLLWAVSLPQIDPRAMSNLGLISVMPPTFVLALLVLTASFLVMIHHGWLRPWLVVAHLLAFVLFVHGTPTIVYGTLRYSWAYKHVGIVDYIVRHGRVDPAIQLLGVYHNWPGFFALIAALIEFGGVRSALTLATWGPVFNNVMFLGALLFLFSGLTRNRRVVWLSCWLFFVANWVGQDYFSPQAFAFWLYLLLLGVIVRWLRPDPGGAPAGRGTGLALAVLLLCAIAPTHALTSVMACVIVTALVLARACRTRWLVLVAAGITVFWDTVFGSDFAGHNLSATLAQIRFPWNTASSNLTHVPALGTQQTLVAHVARGLTLAVAGLAAAGAVRQLRAGRLDRAVAIIAVAPLALFATGNYDGELLFRIFLFSVPALAFLASHALLAGGRRTSAALSAIAVTVLLGGFLVSYYGNERLNYFTPQELAANHWLDTHAPADSLLIDGTGNYLFTLKNYERFREYLSISTQPAATQTRILRDPVGVLYDWMSNRSYRASYMLIARSQSIEVQADGLLPAGSLAMVQRRLLASRRFRVVFRNSDAIVFSLANARAVS
jgi:O-antigen/teichoic acid export membrane protein